ncbi:uncharacterized protein O3C94_023087 [Discoglossus pictus]
MNYDVHLIFSTVTTDCTTWVRTSEGNFTEARTDMLEKVYAQRVWEATHYRILPMTTSTQKLPDLKDAEAVQKFFLEEIQLGEDLLAQEDRKCSEFHRR